MTICKNCGGKADTTQHLFQKSATDPKYYVRLPLCKFCHNYGINCSNQVSQLILNNIDREPNQKIVCVNNTSVMATIGSLDPLQLLTFPNETFSLSIENKNTKQVNDFKILSSGANAFCVSGASLVSGANFVYLSSL